MYKFFKKAFSQLFPSLCSSIKFRKFTCMDAYVFHVCHDKIDLSQWRCHDCDKIIRNGLQSGLNDVDFASVFSVSERGYLGQQLYAS